MPLAEPLQSPPCSGRTPHHLWSSSSSSVLWNLGIRAVAAGQPRMRVWRSSGCGCGSRRASVGSHSQSTPTSHLGSVLSTPAGCFSVRSGPLSTVIHRVWGQRCAAGAAGMQHTPRVWKTWGKVGKGGDNPGETWPGGWFRGGFGDRRGASAGAADAPGQLGDLVVDRALLTHQHPDLAVGVHDGGVVATAERLPDLG